MKKLVVVALLFVITCTACQKHSSPWYSGMQIINYNDSFVRWNGNTDNDWKVNGYTLTAQQLALLPVNYNSYPDWYLTKPGDVFITPGVCPIGIDTPDSYYRFTVNVQYSCIVSYAITDEQLNVLTSGCSFAIDSQLVNNLIKINPAYLQPGKAYRVFFACSAVNHLYYAVGWGDIGACSLNAYNDVTRCF